MLLINGLKIVTAIAALVMVATSIFYARKLYVRLKTYWANSNVPKSHRTFHKILYAVAVYFLAVVVIGLSGFLLNVPLEMETRAVARKELQDKADALAALKVQLDAERGTLLQLVQQKVAEGKLQEAKQVVSKYSSLNDPALQQAVALIDREISIAALVASTKSETDPAKLEVIYRKLSKLVPTDPAYGLQAEQYALAAQRQAKERAAEEAKGKANEAKYAAAVARIDNCVAAGNCAFKVWGAAAGPASMSFWILESEWRNFTEIDKDALRGKLYTYVSNMQRNAQNYATNTSIGAGVPRNASAFPVVVENIRNASGWTVFTSPGRDASGGLKQGREIKKF
jgi:hypothetical protein